MTVDEDHGRALSRPDYWDGRYADGRGHEWFRTFKDLEPFFQQNLVETELFAPQADPQVLHLGSGDSALPAELALLGYARQICVDFSPVVVDMMSKRHSHIPGIEWKQADVRSLGFLPSKCIDVAFDKGTLDAFIFGSCWSPPEEVKMNTERYMREVHRVLQDGGVFLYITFRQAQFIRPLLNPEGRLWEMNMQILQSEEGTFPYYGYVLQKRTSQPDDGALSADSKEGARCGEELEEAQPESGDTVTLQMAGESPPADPEMFGALFS